MSLPLNPDTQEKRKINSSLPISRLPDEILSEIILHSGKYVRDSRSQWHSPFNVCKIWREFAIYTTPRLWTEIIQNGVTNNLSLEKFRTWILRSKALPMKIFISDRVYASNHVLSKAMGQAVTEALRPGLVKALEVRINVHFPSFFQQVPDICASSPFLDTLTLSPSWELFEASSFHPRSILSHPIHTLQQLRFDLPPHDPSSSLTISPQGSWPALTSICIQMADNISIELHDFLKNVPMLEDIELESIFS